MDKEQVKLQMVVSLTVTSILCFGLISWNNYQTSDIKLKEAKMQGMESSFFYGQAYTHYNTGRGYWPVACLELDNADMASGGGNEKYIVNLLGTEVQRDFSRLREVCQNGGK